jgi:hypothetical protein
MLLNTPFFVKVISGKRGYNAGKGRAEHFYHFQKLGRMKLVWNCSDDLIELSKISVETIFN